MVDFLFFFPNPNKIVALIIKRKHSIRVIGTAYRNRADSIIFENGKPRYITKAGERCTSNMTVHSLSVKFVQTVATSNTSITMVFNTKARPLRSAVVTSTMTRENSQDERS